MKGAKKAAKGEGKKAAVVVPSPGPELRSKRKAAAEELPSSSAPKKAAAGPPAAAAAAAAPSASAAKVKARMVKKLFAAIKRTPHNTWQKKPYTEVVEGVDLEEALALIGPTPFKTPRNFLEGEEKLRAWLGVPTTVIHPVSDKGMPRYVLKGAPWVPIYLWAQIESVEVKYNKTSKILSMKARTMLIGSGEPRKNGTCPNLTIME